MAISPELVPPGMTVVKKITPHCFINSQGEVVFLRKIEGERTPVVFKNIYDAISQCFHILDNTLGEMMDFYRRQPEVYGPGEMDEMRRIAEELQAVISFVISSGSVSEEAAAGTKRTLEQIRRRLGAVRNVHKLMLVDHLQKVSAVRDGQGMRQVGVVLEPALAHLDSIRRFDELDNISRGVVAQADRLIDLAILAEWRIKNVYQTLCAYEAEVGMILDRVEYHERQSGHQPVSEYSERLRAIARAVAGEKSNKVVNALRGMAVVEPFKSRLESAEVKCLEKLPHYLEIWESGKAEALRTFYRAFGRARGKLKRVVREQKSPAAQRILARQYKARL